MQSIEIKVRGHIDEHWSETIEGLVISHERGGDTLLRATVCDQAELYGLIAKLRDLGLQIVSIRME